VKRYPRTACASWLVGLLVIFALPFAMMSCGGGGGGGSSKGAVSALREWVAEWAARVDRGRVPNEFRVPSPPAVELGSFADGVGRDVDQSVTDVSTDIGDTYQQVKDVFCYWFGWYIDTGRAVPSSEEFPGLLLRYGFNKAVPSPPTQRARNAIELFRKSIDSAQSEDEATQNAAVAAACSIPS
jgi:hypothetical protein